MAPRTTKKPRLSHSTRAGIIFPVTHMHRHLKTAQTAITRITKGAAVYSASVVEYLVAEVFELSGNAAQHNQRTRITPRHILLALATDKELDKLLHGCVIPQGGVLPSIRPFLVKKSGTSNKQDEPSSSSSSITSSTRTKKTAVFSSTKKMAVHKPALTKDGSETSKVIARKRKLNIIKRNMTDIKADATIHPKNNALDTSDAVEMSKGEEPL